MTETHKAKTAIEHVQEMPMRRLPWQLVIVCNGSDNTATVSQESTIALTRLFDHLPNLTGVTLRTDKGDLVVTRDFPFGEMQMVDSVIASVFEHDPHITGIIFPATGNRPKHVATVDKPHFLPPKKERP